MPASSQTRPICGQTNPLNIADGTLCLWESPRPGPLGVRANQTVLGSQPVGDRHQTRAPGPARTAHIQVTERMIRDAMKDAPLKPQQKGGISLPRVQRFVEMLLAGEEPPLIKVDGTMIVDGNHRYVAARILRIEPPVQMWAGGRPADAIPWDQLPIDQKFW